MSLSEMWRFRDDHYVSQHFNDSYRRPNFLCSHPVLFFSILCQGTQYFKILILCFFQPHNSFYNLCFHYIVNKAFCTFCPRKGVIKQKAKIFYDSQIVWHYGDSIYQTFTVRMTKCVTETRKLAKCEKVEIERWNLVQKRRKQKLTDILGLNQINLDMRA